MSLNNVIDPFFVAFVRLFKKLYIHPKRFSKVLTDGKANLIVLVNCELSDYMDGCKRVQRNSLRINQSSS